jgi:hypothetical protein
MSKPSPLGASSSLRYFSSLLSLSATNGMIGYKVWWLCCDFPTGAMTLWQVERLAQVLAKPFPGLHATSYPLTATHNLLW